MPLTPPDASRFLQMPSDAALCAVSSDRSEGGGGSVDALLKEGTAGNIVASATLGFYGAVTLLWAFLSQSGFS